MLMSIFIYSSIYVNSYHSIIVNITQMSVVKNVFNPFILYDNETFLPHLKIHKQLTVLNITNTKVRNAAPGRPNWIGGVSVHVVFFISRTICLGLLTERRNILNHASLWYSAFVVFVPGAWTRNNCTGVGNSWNWNKSIYRRQSVLKRYNIAYELWQSN